MLHFNLGHIRNAQQLYVQINSRNFPLKPHSNSTRKSASTEQGAPLGESVYSRFTHYLSVKMNAQETNSCGWIKVMKKSPDGIPLDKPVLMARHIPASALRAYYREKLEPASHPNALKTRAGDEEPTAANVFLSGKLKRLGVNRLPESVNDTVELLVASHSLIDSMDTAAGLVAHCPELASIQPYTATQVMNEHILSPALHNDLQILAQAIEEAGEDWSPVVPSVDAEGNQLKAEYDLMDETGGFKANDLIYTYDLADNVVAALEAPVIASLKSAAQDPKLRNKSWVSSLGNVQDYNEAEAFPQPVASSKLAGELLEYKWTVNIKGSRYGVELHPDSIEVTDSDRFSIDVSNSAMRTLRAGYRLMDQDGNYSRQEKLRLVNATNDIMGVSVSTLPTRLELDLNRAREVELSFGSMGTGPWNPTLTPDGVAFTGLNQYGIPAIFMVAGAMLNSSKTFRKIMEDDHLQYKLATIFAATGIIGGSALYGETGNFWTLSKVANTAMGVVVKKGVEKLGKWVLKEVGGAALLNAAGPVAWVARIAAMTAGTIRMSVTSLTVLASPAAMSFRVSRAIDVKMVLKPDPEHGEVGNPDSAIWPSVATRYLATLLYSDGTSIQLAGPLPEVTSNAPLHLLFEDVPAGGRFRIQAGVYSDSGWLAGAWASDWFDSIPDRGAPRLDIGEHTIEEHLVPLSPDTQYKYKEDIVFKNGAYSWAVETPSDTTIKALNGGANGSISELLGITLNNSAYQIGYAWRASGQSLHPNVVTRPESNQQLFAVQNLSVLAEPGERLITTEVGFTEPAHIAYAAATNRGDCIDQRNFVLDPRNGKLHLRQVELKTANESRTFGLEATDQLSWGSFPLPSVDALAVHPSNAVVACSFQHSKLMVLQLPDSPSADNEAELAIAVSGEGLRQGLMRGPKALAIAPNGNILVLESENNRVQAFDLHGNSVPGFTTTLELFTLKTSEIAADLDAGNIPEVFWNTLVTHFEANYLTTLDSSLAETIVAGVVAPESMLVQALAERGIMLAIDPEAQDDPLYRCEIIEEQAGSSWTLTDPRGFVYRLENGARGINVHELPSFSSVETQTPGKQWLIVDKRMARSWKLTPSTANADTTLVKECTSYFPINETRDTRTYLDMTVEAEGHVYILYYIEDGSQPAHYFLDIYGPDGRLVVRTPDTNMVDEHQHLVAGRIAIDIWRNIYALPFSPMKGMEHTVQPGVMHWHPTPPLFSMPAAEQENFNDRNIEGIVQAFKIHGGIDLDPNASLHIIDPEGTWHIKDGAVEYHIYRCSKKLHVYLLKAY